MKNKMASVKKSKSIKSSKSTKAVKDRTGLKTAGSKDSIKAPAASPIKASTKDILIKNLQGLVKGIDEEGIKFLISQAEVLARRAAAGNDAKDQRKAQIAEQISNKGTLSNKYTITVKEADDKSNFIIVINNARNFFTLDEMRKLVRICHDSKGEMEASRRLFAWFSQFRKDVIIDTHIDGASDLALSTIYKYLINNYTAKSSS